jgi:hypothetical protein
MIILKAKFGMTPEKLAEGRDIISRDAAESNTPLMSLSDKKSTPSNAQLGGSCSIAAASPSMSTRSPKPFSQTLNQNVSLTPTPTTPTGYAVDYRSALTKFYQAHSPDKIADVDAALQKYQVRLMMR